MEKLQNLGQIDTNRIEGRLLIAALGKLTSGANGILNANHVLSELCDKAIELYKDQPLPIPEMRGDFVHELTKLLNQFSKENQSDTPDFILAQFMQDSLHA